MNSSRILVVSDDQSVCQAIRKLIEREPLVLIQASDAQGGLKQASTGQPDLVIVDLQFSSSGNFEFCRQLRLLPVQAPIIVLSEVEDEVDKILLLETGADDYIVKPFAPRGLLARMRALLRRARDTTLTHKFADIGVNLTQRIVNKGGEEVKLTPAEYNLLTFFLQHPDRVIPRDMILSHVWGYDFYVNTRTVDVHVMKLRQKLEPDQKVARHFRTVHGVGYRFVPY